MLLTIIIVSILLLMLPFLLAYIKNNNLTHNAYEYSDYESIIFGSWVLLSISLLSFIIVIGVYVSMNYNEERIELLEQHNQEIESKIRVVVEQYLEHEGSVYDFENQDVTILFVLIPQLSSNTIVQKEMELYISNSDEIKSLRLERINKKVLAWWLWFGNA